MKSMLVAGVLDQILNLEIQSLFTICSFVFIYHFFLLETLTWKKFEKKFFGKIFFVSFCSPLFYGKTHKSQMSIIDVLFFMINCRTSETINEFWLYYIIKRIGTLCELISSIFLEYEGFQYSCLFFVVMLFTPNISCIAYRTVTALGSLVHGFQTRKNSTCAPFYLSATKNHIDCDCMKLFSKSMGSWTTF